MKAFLNIVSLFTLFSCSPVPDGLGVLRINEKGIVGEYIFKDGNEKNPIIIVLPGSGKDLMDINKMIDLVHDGYDILSVAYYGKAPLPERISRIPIEYVKKCIAWTKEGFNRKVILMGISKGAELALLYASKYGDIDGLICYSPSSVVLPDHVGVDSTTLLLSSWTYQGEDVEFAQIQRFNEEAGVVNYSKYTEPLLKVDNSIQLEGGIEVEKISCSTLLLSGKSDSIWPSFRMSKSIVKRMSDHGKGNKVKMVGYDNAGHQFFWLSRKPPTSITTGQSIRLTGIKKHSFMFGGTKKGTITAMQDSRKQVLEFLNTFKS